MKIVISESEKDNIRKMYGIINEAQDSTSALNSINQELSSGGLPNLTMDELNGNDLPASWTDLHKKLGQGENQDNNLKSSTIQKFENVVCNASEDQLHQAKKQLISIIGSKLKRFRDSIKNAFKGNQNEQVAETATILGITAPMWVFIAIGAVLLFLICKFIIFKRRDGFGCHGNESWSHVVRRINSGY